MTVTLKNGALTARIESKGAELLSLVKNETEYMWQKDPAFWGKTSPVLFPIVGNLRNDTVTLMESPIQWQSTVYAAPQNSQSKMFPIRTLRSPTPTMRRRLHTIPIVLSSFFPII